MADWEMEALFQPFTFSIFITCYFDEIKACTKHEHLYYRGSIEAGAANLGIKLSHQLFECVFGPIDDELLKRYRKLKG